MKNGCREFERQSPDSQRKMENWRRKYNTLFQQTPPTRDLRLVNDVCRAKQVRQRIFEKGAAKVLQSRRERARAEMEQQRIEADNDNTMTTPNAQPALQRNTANTNSNNSNRVIQMNNRNVNRNVGSNFIQRAPERMDDDVVNGINQMNTVRPTRNCGRMNRINNIYNT
jgi:hypothetical protein